MRLNMDLSDRELLIRIEQKLQNSVSNYKQHVLDLKEIFGKIETNSKSLVSIETNQKTMMENQKQVDEKFKDNELKFSELRKTIDKEENERIAFENEIKGGQKAYRLVLLIISAIATLMGIVSVIWNLKP